MHCHVIQWFADKKSSAGTQATPEVHFCGVLLGPNTSAMMHYCIYFFIWKYKSLFITYIAVWSSNFWTILVNQFMPHQDKSLLPLNLRWGGQVVRLSNDFSGQWMQEHGCAWGSRAKARFRRRNMRGPRNAHPSQKKSKKPRLPHQGTSLEMQGKRIYRVNSQRAPSPTGLCGVVDNHIGWG